MTLTNAVNLYIGARQAAGERFHSPAVVLRSFSHQAGNKSLNIITPEEIVGFLSGPRTGHGTWQKKYGTLRVFFEYWRQRQKLSVVPMPPSLPKYTSPFMPYIYSKEELRSLLKVIPQCQQRRWCQMSDATFRMLLLLLYGTGMRIGEALRLCLIDVDLDNDIIQIRGTKFYKSRLVPLGRDVRQLLRSYLALPKKDNRGDRPVFQSKAGHAISRSAVEISFRRLCRLGAVHRDGGSVYQPRIHDLRHTFAVHRLTEWYRHGANVQILLPALSTYLGHVGLHSTQRYLTMTPELLKEANQRFELYVSGGRDEQ